MEHKHICQSCSMPLGDQQLMGTEQDGSVNQDYCIYCYKNGEFTNPGMTMEEMQTFMKEKMTQMQMAQPVINKAVNSLPELKRWTSRVHIL